jgi:hypothetical protein
MEAEHITLTQGHESGGNLCLGPSSGCVYTCGLDERVKVGPFSAPIVKDGTR